jgi:uncharacterized repeat protein (TIGR03803 family)
MTCLTQHRAIRHVMAAFLILFAMAPTVQAQTLTVLHSFTDGADGAQPFAGLTMDRGGNLYGTTSAAFANTSSAFELKSVGEGWLTIPVFTFYYSERGTYGFGLLGKAVFGPDGALYGSAQEGGSNTCDLGCGTIFKLRPHSTFCASVLCGWNITVLYYFSGDSGAYPDQIVFGSDGNIYGTTYGGGILEGSCSQTGLHGCGTVYQLTNSGGTWTRNILYEFHGNDGSLPEGGVVFDSAGNLYGATYYGGSNNLGVIYKLSPAPGLWTQTILHTFQGGTDGEYPPGLLTMDASGNLYGVAQGGGMGSPGTVFELSPPGTWSFQTLYSPLNNPSDGGLLLGSSGNIYGTTRNGGPNRAGTVFKLTFTNGSWSLTDLHDFIPSEGIEANSGLIMDAHGNLYGTSAFGGAAGNGTAWKLTP